MVFEKAGRPLSPEEVLEMAQADVPGLGIATVYRTIRTLLDQGWLAAVNVPGQSACYELAGLHHHHHFHCEECGRVYDFEGCPGDMDRFTPAGFKTSRHELLLYGRCAECSRG
jgi:Fur family ferric uptake transcriptional regulator